MGISSRQRRSIWCLLAFTHLVMIFCCIWFLLSHIWFLPEIATQYYACGTTLHRFTQLIILSQYIVGSWFIFSRIWNSPRALRWIQKQIQNRLQKFDSENEPSSQETTIQKHNYNDQLNCI